MVSVTCKSNRKAFENILLLCLVDIETLLENRIFLQEIENSHIVTFKKNYEFVQNMADIYFIFGDLCMLDDKNSYKHINENLDISFSTNDTSLE